MMTEMEGLRNQLVKQQAERAKLERTNAILIAKLARAEQSLSDITDEFTRVQDLLRESLLTRTFERQAVPDVLHAVECYIGGQTESRLERQIRSERMIHTSIVLRDAMVVLYGSEAGEEV